MASVPAVSRGTSSDLHSSSRLYNVHKVQSKAKGPESQRKTQKSQFLWKVLFLANFHWACLDDIHSDLLLFLEEDLYSAAPLTRENKNLQFRRIYGKRKQVWTDENWMKSPKFIGVSHIKRADDPDNEKIYLFFMERSLDEDPNVDPWISRVAQVCKVDEGGPKVILNSRWTTFLKAKLRCSIPSEAIYFNRLQDVFVLHSENWRESRVYGLFTSTWNFTAVCVYSVEEIDRVFRESTLKGYSSTLPNPRPGTCHVKSQQLFPAMLQVVKDHQEVDQWVQPIGDRTPLFFGRTPYQKITVDQVRGADGVLRKVLLLATGDRKIHKVVEDKHTPFNMLEIHPFKTSAAIQSMTLDSTTKKLYVGSAHEVVEISLENCDWHGNTKLDCQLSRDPYCTWRNGHCTSVRGEPSKDLRIGKVMNPNVRLQTNNIDTNKAFQHEEQELTNHVVPLFSKFFLSCPVNSQHAHYWWLHNNTTKLECVRDKDRCIYLLQNVTPQQYGTYTCISEEEGYQLIVTQQSLMMDRGKQTILAIFIVVCLFVLTVFVGLFLCRIRMRQRKRFVPHGHKQCSQNES
ncbi:semaphorin-7A [Latimeria chalumnae]|uniref:semaphorin-7A n=1 Tax=Latimeria chalumnae TaxID=7897 RepID=UPI00313DCAF2